MKAIDELKEMLKEREINDNGKYGTTVAAKKAVIEYADATNISDNQVSRQLGLSNGTLSQWRSKFNMPNKRMSVRTVQHGKMGVRYAVSTKIEASKMVLENGHRISHVASKIGCSPETLSRWIADYRDGLYKMENVVQISRKKFKTSEVLMAEIDDLEDRDWETTNL